MFGVHISHMHHGNLCNQIINDDTDCRITYNMIDKYHTKLPAFLIFLLNNGH